MDIHPSNFATTSSFYRFSTTNPSLYLANRPSWSQTTTATPLASSRLMRHPRALLVSCFACEEGDEPLTLLYAVLEEQQGDEESWTRSAMIRRKETTDSRHRLSVRLPRPTAALSHTLQPASVMAPSRVCQAPRPPPSHPWQRVDAGRR